MTLRHFVACHCLAFSLQAAEVELSSPLDYQVIQRSSRTEGTLAIRGTQTGLDGGKTIWRVKTVTKLTGSRCRWRRTARHFRLP